MELDYYRRMKEEYGDELGLYGRVDAPEDIDPALIEATGDGGLDGHMDRQIKSIYDSTAIIDEIDDEIKRITEGESDEMAKKKNMKVAQRQK